MTESDHLPHTEHEIHLDSPGYLSFSRQVILGILGTALAGGIGAVLAALLYTDGMRRLMLAYLVALAFVLSISLGSLFFILIQHLTRAGWAVLIRRPAEVLALNVITVGVLALPIIAFAFSGSVSIYPWARVVGSDATLDALPTEHARLRSDSFVHLVASHTEAIASIPIEEDRANSHSTNSPDGEPPHAIRHAETEDQHAHLYAHQTFDELTASKTAWLNPAFFSVRLVLYFGIWSAMAWFFFSTSRRQDEVGGTKDTLLMEQWSPPLALAFALTLTFAAFDLLMSLNPHWYSTIFGVYYFAGCAVGGFASSLLVWLVLSRIGKMPAKLSEAHFRDLGRLLFAFIFFWGYIAFSQYMLLWYANIPETTSWWAVRGASLADGYRSSWGYVLVILLFGHFIVPFLGIMSRHVKDHQRAMMGWSIFILFMHYIDLYWLVMPEFRPWIAFGLPEIGSLMLVGGLYCIGATYFATQTALVPVGDPRIAPSAALKDMY
ncbi:MAG: hypothetical protein KDB22_01635 [Planctomycetales bacterium]|nr:hypothetical protein [Planctomycetales bacterium]